MIRGIGSETIESDSLLCQRKHNNLLGSTLFLGAALSSWTQTVITDRLARGIKRHDSVLEVVGKGKILKQR